MPNQKKWIYSPLLTKLNKLEILGLEKLNKNELIKLILDFKKEFSYLAFVDFDRNTAGAKAKAEKNYENKTSKIEAIFYELLKKNKKIPTCDEVVDKLNKVHKEHVWINDSFANPEKGNIRVYKVYLQITKLVAITSK